MIVLVVVTSGTASNFFMFFSARECLAFSLLYIFNASLTTDTMIIINLSKGFQTAMAKIVTIQKKVWEPSCTEIRPSFLVSQKAVAADCSPEPLFCVMMQVTAYLKGFARRASSLMQVSMICWHHWFTFSFW